jgi:hypothetical protein
MIRKPIISLVPVVLFATAGCGDWPPGDADFGLR